MIQKVNRIDPNKHRITETKKQQQVEEKDQTILTLFQCIEKEYEEKIKMLTEKCFILERQLQQYWMETNKNDLPCEHASCQIHVVREQASPQFHEEEHSRNASLNITRIAHPSVNDEIHNQSCKVMMDCGNNDHSLCSSPFGFNETSMTTPSKPQQRRYHDGMDHDYQIILSPPLELERYCNAEDIGGNINSLLNSNTSSSGQLLTPQRRAVVNKPLETHFSYSPALSDSSSEADLDFNWLFEQDHLSQVSTASTSTISKRSTRQSEKKEHISQVIEHLQTHLHAEIILPNLTLMEGDAISSSSSIPSPSLSQDHDHSLSKTPMSEMKRSTTKRLTTPNGSSELTFSVAALKKSQRSQNSRIYTRTDYKYRDYSLSENIIFFCKYIKFKPEYLLSHDKLGLSNLYFDVIDLVEKERSKFKFLKSNKDSMIIGDCDEGLIVVKLLECEKTFHTHVLSKLNKVLVSKQEHRKKKLVREYCFGAQSLSQVFDFDFNIYLLRDSEPSRHEGPFSIFDVLLNCKCTNP
ncbi:hypothetical protein C9374_004206 [Naegleria lovaniensis]|uniref:Uncharacterized protein n=1 Tax=Naegleria lovaniensis TaxID=51637 RepID=A0AA88GSY0_NAELO|nr:uncharacterized protein C9374_004206 [Naegleria lovaniensis]KAG2383535.1 hypothetical protein C9374_004206 [Naegleria lovaniensis]